jgi:hypothetical protein
MVRTLLPKDFDLASDLRLHFVLLRHCPSTDPSCWGRWKEHIVRYDNGCCSNPWENRKRRLDYHIAVPAMGWVPRWVAVLSRVWAWASALYQPLLGLTIVHNSHSPEPRFDLVRTCFAQSNRKSSLFSCTPPDRVDWRSLKDGNRRTNSRDG